MTKFTKQVVAFGIAATMCLPFAAAAAAPAYADGHDGGQATIQLAETGTTTSVFR